jgi:PQQ-dependent dehydrogenase (s-GDH family)
MKSLVAVALGALLAPLPLIAQDTSVPGTVPFDQSVLISGLDGPWELTWGPDNMLWVTERFGGRILRINPESGERMVAATFYDMVTGSGQDGLLGMAMDPGFGLGKGQDHVYAFYTYNDFTRLADPTVDDPKSPFLNMYSKVVRLTFDPATGKLSAPQVLIDGLPAGADHVSGRLKAGPDGKLYLTLGDQGNGQFGNFCLPILAQRLPTAEEVQAKDYFSYQGKSLRMNLDGSVPDDNPEIAGVRSHVFTFGHRNMQGIAFGPDGTLYASEQGPKTDDEVNVLTPGSNYGWPHVSGFQDDLAYQYTRWTEASPSCQDQTFSDISVDPKVPQEAESAWPGPFNAPLASLFTVPNGWNFEDPACNGMNFICWPTVAAASIEVYRPAKGGIPGFDNALLVPALKRGSIYRVPLSADGLHVAGPVERYFRTDNRYRDTAISPDGKTIYVATDPGGLHEGLTGEVDEEVADPGAILVFRYNDKS